MTLPPSYFDDLYAASPDPWGFTDRWYERRKRALTLALLPQPRYGTAFEPGCSIGVLTRELADRCDALLSIDVSEAAVTACRERCADLPQVTVDRATTWPDRAFDLVVLSEVGYYFDRAALLSALDGVCRSGTVLAVHWRHPVTDYPLGGDEVHALLADHAAAHGLSRVGGYLDDDVVAEVWCRDGRPVAARGGLS